jgi:hypothetical protein
MKREATSRTIQLIMAFAIFWMVIGDLITYHQEKIFGTNYYEHHTPFTKPGSKDDGKTSHIKFGKDFDKQSHHILLLFVNEKFTYSAGLFHNGRFLQPKPYLFLRHQCLKNIISLRGPPSIS